jgi:hypothetical protein
MKLKKYDKENFSEVVKKSTNKTDVLKKLDMKMSGGNFNTISKYIMIYDLDISHFKKNNDNIQTNTLKLMDRTKRRIPLFDILVENSAFSTTHLKERLYKEGVKKRKCELCGQGEKWKGKKMSLILDHISGVRFDNRIENLRIVCPNCNATLDTHCGKNKK